MFVEEYRLWSSSLCSFLQSPVTSSRLDTNTLLSTLFSNTLSLRSSVNVRDKASNPYQATGQNYSYRGADKITWLGVLSIIFSIVTLIYPLVYKDRVSGLVHISDRVFFASKHIMFSLNALYQLTRHVYTLSLRLLLKYWPSKLLHLGRRVFPTFQENWLCLNLWNPELSFSWIFTDFRINLHEGEEKCLRNTSTYILHDVKKRKPI